MVERYSKGKRTHTRWDRKSEQITVAAKRRPPLPEPKIPVSAEDIRPVRANLFIVHHRAEEFVIDFGFIPPGAAKVRVAQRVITSPVHAKALCKALERMIR
jgi:hypothetical protein